MPTLADRIAQATKIILAAIAAFFRILFGGAREAGALLARDARRIGRVARGIGEATAAVVGTGLSGPARLLDAIADAIGSTLGALLPRPTVGPKQAADAAVAHDDHLVEPVDPLAAMPAAARSKLMDASILGTTVQLAAAARARGDEIIAGTYDEDLPAHVSAWLDSLSPKQLARVAATPTFHVAAHVEGRSLTAGLPPVLAAPASVTDRAAMQRTLAEIRRIAKAERAEAVERMTGGGARPAALPTEDDDYAPTGRTAFRPAFH